MLLSGHQHASKTVVLILCVSGESSPHNPTHAADDRQQGTRSPKNLYGILFYSLQFTYDGIQRRDILPHCSTNKGIYGILDVVGVCCAPHFSSPLHTESRLEPELGSHRRQHYHGKAKRLKLTPYSAQQLQVSHPNSRRPGNFSGTFATARLTALVRGMHTVPIIRKLQHVVANKRNGIPVQSHIYFYFRKASRPAFLIQFFSVCVFWRYVTLFVGCEVQISRNGISLTAASAALRAMWKWQAGERRSTWQSRREPPFPHVTPKGSPKETEQVSFPTSILLSHPRYFVQSVNTLSKLPPSLPACLCQKLGTKRVRLSFSLFTPSGY